MRGAARRDTQGGLFEIINVGDIGPVTGWTAVLKNIDVVIHLAGRVHVMNDHVADQLADYRRVNVAGTERLARMALQSGIQRFIYISSVKVNGGECSRPYRETDDPAVIDPYGRSKWEAEQVLRKISAETGLEVVIVRPPLVYGPGVKANFLSLLKVVYKGWPLPFGSVNNRRSFIYLGNLIDAIIQCMENPKAAGQTFLVSDNEDVSTPVLLRMIAQALGRPARVFSFPPFLIHAAASMLGKSSAVDRLLGSLYIDSSRIRDELGWSPPHSMAQGLKHTAEWFLTEVKTA